MSSELSTNTFTSLIVTHNNRIQQFLEIFRIRKFVPNNCAVLKMIIIISGSSPHVSIEHIWDGSNQVYSEMYNSDVTTETLTKLIPIKYQTKSCQYTFYITRHAQGIHNIIGIETIKNLVRTDPYLTPEGESQALATGAFLQSLEIPNIDVYFVSTLQRTHQTLAGILRGMLPTEISINAIVLPRSEEISMLSPGSENKSDCYSTTNMGTFLRQEYRINFNPMARCSKIKYLGLTLNIDWNFWNDNSISIFNHSEETLLYYAIKYIWENKATKKMLGGRLRRKSFKRKQYRKKISSKWF